VRDNAEVARELNRHGSGTMRARASAVNREPTPEQGL